MKEDEDGKYKFTGGKRCIVIGYIMEDRGEIKKGVERMESRREDRLQISSSSRDMD